MCHDGRMSDEHDDTMHTRLAQTHLDPRAIEEKRQEVDSLKDRFVEIIGHQLRTPLSVMRWNLESLLAQEFGPVSETVQDVLKVTYGQNLEAISRVSDVVTMLDMEEGRSMKFSRMVVELDGLSGELIPEWRQECELKHVACAFHLPKEPLPSFIGDADKIKMAMQHLFRNALWYTQPGGTITVTLDRIEGAVRCTVKDTGIGMAAIDQPHVFERFFRAANAITMKTDAFGIGLYVSKYYIEQHGGTLKFESREGEGSTFWFELPINTTEGQA